MFARQAVRHRQFLQPALLSARLPASTVTATLARSPSVSAASALLTKNSVGFTRSMSSTSASTSNNASETPVSQSSSSNTNSSNSNSNNSNGQGESKWGRRFRYTRYAVYSTVTACIAYTGYIMYLDHNPPVQLDYDPSKKTVVVLGTGWGATSLLKTLDTEHYNVVVVSPRNYFLFTPLLPSCTVGTVSNSSILNPIRYITRLKKRAVRVVEAECTDIDPATKTVTIEDKSEIKGAAATATIPYDYLVVAVGAENNTFGIPGVQEHACFLKEIWDAKKIRARLMDCIESAGFPGQPDDEIDRLMHIVVVGGGPTGCEAAAEFSDMLHDDLKVWIPELADRLKITLIEADRRVLPSFNSQLIDYTMSTFKENKINVMLSTRVTGVEEKQITIHEPNGTVRNIPFGLLVWATGNTSRPVVRSLMAKLPESQNVRRGLVVDEFLRIAGTENVWALGDATATKYAPLAQVAAQQGQYLGKILNNMAVNELQEQQQQQQQVAQSQDVATRKPKKIKPFEYTSHGSLAYIGAERAVADLPVFHGNVSSGGVTTFLLWQTAYLSMLYSVRNRVMVSSDWLKRRLFGRDISRE
ncbi:FAD/NAD(P)-binding domain-containing protein [Ramicandelaber brevisporus]|nr:FAD/NAD(P)-binding domain-containing protein [Ramicandelaber brevisporus]